MKLEFRLEMVSVRSVRCPTNALDSVLLLGTKPKSLRAKFASDALRDHGVLLKRRER